MSQKSSVPQRRRSVSEAMTSDIRVLTPDSRHHIERGESRREPDRDRSTTAGDDCARARPTATSGSTAAPTRSFRRFMVTPPAFDVGKRLRGQADCFKIVILP